MRILVIFSNPPGQARLRLDKEDKIIAQLARSFKDSMVVERLHASEIDDVHTLIIDGEFDIIQFSGHGSPQGIYLEKSNYNGEASDLVIAKRVVNILELANKIPLLTIFLSCYSNESLNTLVDAAPFVITALHNIGDKECLIFVQGFYERLFRGSSIQLAFDHATHLLAAKGLPTEGFQLSRRSLLKKGDSLFVESTPKADRDSILVNLDAVREHLSQFGLTEEELCHLLAKKLKIHYWIFDQTRDNATIPIGQLLFGEFQWKNAKDVVYCTRLMKLRSDVPRKHWEIWSKVLTSYNDLASLEYRSVENPSSPTNYRKLERAVKLFNYHLQKNLIPLREMLEQMGFSSVVPNLEFTITHCERATEQFDLERYPQVVVALEQALTNYHEIVTALQPPEEEL